uniref:Uncharacterized protein n=1 Tax=Arundo donax TaxID=35708 RepID=A0A0A8YRF5_ARUDO
MEEIDEKVIFGLFALRGFTIWVLIWGEDPCFRRNRRPS